MNATRAALLAVVPALGAFLARPASALQLDGQVINKLGLPLAKAKICADSGRGVCATTDSTGTFSLTAPDVRVRARGEGPMGWAAGPGKVGLRAPRAMPARVRWLDARGRELAPARDQALAAGLNWIAPPAGTRDGLFLLDVSGAGFSARRTVAWLGGNPQVSPSAPPAPAAAVLGKVAAYTYSPTQVSLTGYQTRDYWPEADTSANARVVLSVLGDTGYVFSWGVRARIDTIDRDAGLVISHTPHAYCDEFDSLQRDSVADTAQYALRNGKLYLWTPGRCFGLALTGGGSDVAGNWTGGQYGMLPMDLRPAECEGGDDYLRQSGKLLSAQFKVGTDTLVTGYRARLCIGDYLTRTVLQAVGFDFDPDRLDSGAALTALWRFTGNNCRFATFAVTDSGPSATLSYFQGRGDSVMIRFTRGGNLCTYTMSLSADAGIRSCPVFWPDSVDTNGNPVPPPPGIAGDTNTFANFVQCMGGNGFFGTGQYNTRSAWGMSRDLRPAAPAMSLDRPRRPEMDRPKLPVPGR